MNEPGALATCARGRSRLIFPGFFLFVAVLFSGCIAPEPKFVPPASPASFPDLVKRVSQTRGLEPKQEIKLATAREATKPPANTPAESYHGAPVAAVERAYKILGLLPSAGDLSKVLSEFRRLDRLIAYDRATSSASWSSGAAQIGAPLAKLHVEKAQEFAPVFAIVQALQEQHFTWRATTDKAALEDRRSAFRALAAGDAALTLLTIGTKETDVPSLPAQIEVASQVGGELDKLAVGLPEFLRRRLTFPYRHGALFVYWAFRSKGWPGVNALYANPPLSTGEILHPERYFVHHEAPLRIFPAHLLRRLKESAVEQTLGEEVIAALLSRGRSSKLPADAAAGWRGDQLFAFHEHNNSTVIWFTAWRTEDQAQAFLNAYRGVLEAHHRVRFDAPAGQKTAPWIARSSDQRGWLLQKNESVVLLASASPANRLLDLAGDAWKDLQIDQEAMEIRFESARLSAQLSARSR